MTTPLTSIQRLLRPKSIAVIGGRFAAAVVRECDKIGFQGEIWPINPKRETMGGRPCFADIASLPGVPDAAFVAVPPEATIEAVRQLADAGAGGAVCYASGFAEVGTPEGIDLHNRLQAVMGDLAVVGPNCYGVLNYLDSVTLWPDEQGGKLLEKGVAIIAQSGNISISFSMQQRSLPLAYLIATGNQAGVTVPEYIDALLEDERVTAIGVHLEGLDDVNAFARAAVKALHKRVPLVVIKSGASDLGGQITMSHTSSLAGSDALYSAFFAKYGIMRAQTIPQFLEALKFLSIVGPLPDHKVATISSSGGEAALVADAVERMGLALPPLVAHQEAALFQELGEKVALSNPLDYHTYIWGDPDAQYRAFKAMMLGEQNVTFKILDYPRPDICDPTTWVNTGRAFQRAANDLGVPGSVVSTMHENMPPDVAAELVSFGIAPMLGLEDAFASVLGAAAIYRHQQTAETHLMLNPSDLVDGDIKTLDEFESKALLAQFDISVPQSAVCSADDAASKAAEIGFPVVVKLLSDTIVHKSDVGGVRVNLNSADEVEAAVSGMSHLSDQFLVEQMAPKPVAELILGVTRDPQFGSAVVVGAGGILVELFKDSVTILPPISRAEAEAALGQLKIAPLLDGYRGQPAADKGALVDAILNLAKLVEQYADRLVEVDINPLFALPAGSGVIAVDGVVRIVAEQSDER